MHRTVELVYTKYMKALIYYDGIQRVEQYMFHKDSFREICPCMAPLMFGVVQGTLSAATYAATVKIAYGRDPSIVETIKVGTVVVKSFCNTGHTVSGSET